MIEIKKGKTYLVTGGSGFLGGELIKRILKFGGKVVTISRSEGQLIKLKQEYPDVEIIPGDISDTFDVQQAMKGVDGVFHLAAFKHVGMAEDRCRECTKSNVIGSLNVLEESINNKVNRVNIYQKDTEIQDTNLKSNTIYSTRMNNSKMNNELLYRNLGIPKNINSWDNRIPGNNELTNNRQYKSIRINDSRSSFNRRLSELRPLSATSAYPIQKNIPFLDMKPKNTSDYNYKKDEYNNNYQQILSEFNKPLSKRI